MNAQKETKKAQTPSLISQFLIYATILFISHIISVGFSMILPNFPIPTALIGLILLFILLSMGIVKLEQVENISTLLISIIGLLFIPSGISLVSSLDLFKNEGLQIIIVVVLSTIAMLAGVAYATKFVLKISERITGHKIEEMD